MTFQIGDQIIHRNYGPGKIIGIEEKRLGKTKRDYYVVRTDQVTLWVPIDATENSIRPPMTGEAFQDLLNFLQEDGTQLPAHHLERQLVLENRMKIRTLSEICEIIRDLTFLSRSKELNRKDSDMMKRAQELLLNEWVVVLGTSRLEARQALADLLQTNPA